MTFTYDGLQASDLDKVRSYVPDKVTGFGPQPDDSNFSDEEIGGFITTEGTWQRAVAAIYESLAGSWATLADTTVGPRREEFSGVAERFNQKAKMARDEFGSGINAGQSGTIFVTRVDGYSDDIPADET